MVLKGYSLSLHINRGEVALQEASTTIKCSSHMCFLPSLSDKTLIDGKSTLVQVGQGDRYSLSVNEAPNTTSNNLDRRIRTLYLP